MGGVATETLPLEQVLGEPVGVLGHSAFGPGVRGHGGQLLKQPEAGTTFPGIEAAPGGVFSSGRLEDKGLFTDPPQTVSVDSRPQLRLVPSVGATLPLIAQVGDLFLVIPPSKRDQDAFPTARLFVCTALSPYASGAVPQWQGVLLTAVSLPGGLPV
jgi:hypothetical protein